jgi:hypothetical protein
MENRTKNKKLRETEAANKELETTNKLLRAANAKLTEGFQRYAITHAGDESADCVARNMSTNELRTAFTNLHWVQGLLAKMKTKKYRKKPLTCRRFISTKGYIRAMLIPF